MYYYLITIHSFFRWLVLISLITGIVMAVKGMMYQGKFGRLSNAIRHWTATISHLQLMLGMGLYMISPLLKFRASAGELSSDQVFFKYIHIVIMVLAIVFITIGSAKAKRASVPYERYRVMLVWFSVALLLILIAIPWPFSPLANRPYFRFFLIL
jgi:small-conductance mechanosensitive channel